MRSADGEEDVVVDLDRNVKDGTWIWFWSFACQVRLRHWHFS